MEAGTIADLILLLHAGIVAFVVLGQVLILLGGALGWAWVRNRVFRLAHLATIAFVVVQTWLGALCPLTILEQRYRTLAGQEAYAGSFIEHWLSRAIFFDAPWWAFVAVYTAFAALVAASWWWVPPRQRSRRAS